LGCPPGSPNQILLQEEEGRVTTMWEQAASEREREEKGAAELCRRGMGRKVRACCWALPDRERAGPSGQKQLREFSLFFSFVFFKTFSKPFKYFEFLVKTTHLKNTNAPA